MMGNGGEIQKVVDSDRAQSKAFKVLRLVLVVAFLALMVALVIVFYVTLLTEHGEYLYVVSLVTLVLAVISYVVYGRRYYESRLKESRVVFAVCFGLGSSFMISGMVRALLGRPLPFPYFWLLFLALIGFGAYVGDKIGRKLKLY